MSDWPRIPLGEIFEIARGGSPRPIDAYITDADDGINWISIADASESSKYIERTKRRIRPEGASRSRAVAPGDLLLTNSMSFGRPYIMRTTGCIHDGWLVLAKKREGIDQDFFYRLLGSDTVYAAFARLAAGATVKNLNIDLVKSVSVPVPPLPEQRRIAAILDQADALRAKRREALAQLDSLTQSIFIEMFGDPSQSTRSFPAHALDELLASPLQNGAYYPKETYSNDGVEMVHMSDAFNGIVKRGALKRVDCSDRDLGKYRLLESDILIARRSLTYEGAAKPCRVPASSDPLIFESSFIRVSPDPTKVMTEYLFRYLQNERVRQTHIRPFVTQSTISGINQSNLEQISVVVPPIDLQRDFAARIQGVETLKATHLAALAECDALFASLQQRAFAGQL